MFDSWCKPYSSDPRWRKIVTINTAAQELIFNFIIHNVHFHGDASSGQNIRDTNSYRWGGWDTGIDVAYLVTHVTAGSSLPNQRNPI